MVKSLLNLIGSMADDGGVMDMYLTALKQDYVEVNVSDFFYFKNLHLMPLYLSSYP